MATALADAYHEVYTDQVGRDYLGMRDYYSLLKFIGRHIAADASSFNGALLRRALNRNFGGKPDVMQRVMRVFASTCKLDDVYALPVQEMITENLEDRDCRHLMILTKHSAAWSILKKMQFVDPGQVVLLVGSEFPEDASELQLIQELNAVKRAMATGSTLVLINHDNMYEALYDVLNQRYVKERTPAGVEHRMLRVAVGMRSALCPVHDDFKLITIVEATHAYSNLDLPLLNRFEKQLLLPSNMLTDALGALVGELREFVEQCAADTDGLSKDEVFFGFDEESTLPSLVLSLESAVDDHVQLKQAALDRLVQAATPLAVFRSKAFSAHKSAYFDSHNSFLNFCQASFTAQTAASLHKLHDPAGSIQLLLTHSPEAHLPTALADVSSSATFAAAPFASIALNEFKSADSLRVRLQQFYCSIHTGSAVLVVQCDPQNVSQSHLRHCISLCEEEAQRRAHLRINDGGGNFDQTLVDKCNELDDPRATASLAKGLVPNFARHIVFLLHLPPRMRSRKCAVPLDFLMAQSVWFVDDIRPYEDSTLKSEALMFQSIGSLVTGDDGLDLWSKLLKLCRPALQRLRVPHPSTPVALAKGYHLYPRRLTTIETIMADPGCKARLLALFKVVFDKPEFDTTPPLQYKIAMIPGRVAGSLRERFDLAINDVIVQVFAHVLALMDRNFGLCALADSLERSDTGSVQLWWQMNAGITEALLVLGPDAVLDNSRIDVRHDGKGDVYIAKFPASYDLVHFFDADAFRETLLRANSNDADGALKMREVLIAQHKASYGETLSQLLAACGQERPLRDYLEDYIVIRGSHFPHVSEEEQLDIYVGVVDSFARGSMNSVAGIHVAMWLNEKRLFHYCSLVAIAGQFSFDLMKKELVKQLSVGASQNACASDCDKAVLSLILAAIQDEQARSFDKANPATWQLWLSFGAQTETHIVALMDMLQSDSERTNDRYKAEVGMLSQQWRGIVVVSLFLSEIALPALESADSHLVAKAISSFKSLAPSCTTETFDFMDALCKCVFAVCTETQMPADVLGTTMGNFLRRYLLEMVFSARAKVPDRPTLEFAMDVVKGNSGLLPEQVCAQLDLRRSILFHLFESPKSNLTAASRKKVVMCLVRYNWASLASEESPDFSALQLYAELHEFQLRAGLKHRAQLDAGDATESSVRAVEQGSIVSRHSSDRSTLLPGLQTIAQARIAVLEFARAILSGFERGETKIAIGSFPASQLLQRGPAAAPWQRYFLRVFYAEGGATQLKVLLQNSKLLAPWVKFQSNREVLSPSPRDALAAPFDPFGRIISENKASLHVTYQDMKFALENSMVSTAGCEASDFRKYVADEHLATEATAAMLVPCAFTGAYVCYTQQEPRDAQKSAALERHVCNGSKLSSSSNGKVFSALFNNFPLCQDPARSVTKLFKLGPDSMVDQILKVQFIIELYATVAAHPKCYFWRCFETPQELKPEFVVTMPANEMKMVLAANIRGITRWYACENGHPFSVGECGMTMEIGKCFCGAPIGGRKHKKLESVQNRTHDELAAEDDPGYNKDYLLGSGSDAILRDSLSAIGVRVLRLCLHGLFSLACAAGTAGSGENLRELIGYTGVDQTADFVADQFNADWDALKELAEVNNESVAAFMSSVLLRCRQKHSVVMRPDCRFATSLERQIWETRFMAEVVTPLLDVGVKRSVATHLGRLAEHCPTDHKVEIVQMVGKELWKEITHSPVSGEPLAVETLLLRYSAPITFDQFKTSFSARPQNRELCPTLGLIMEVEEDLSIIKHLPAILAWHNVLFGVFQDGLSRDKAAVLTNAAVVAMLPERKQLSARKILERYCDGFNEVFPSIDRIFECQENPFTGLTMSPDTPVTFSLPNETELEGCCTIQLLAKLHKAHNDVILKYGETIQRGNEQHSSRNLLSPIVDYRVPYASLRSRVIEYARDADLLPLVIAFSQQPLAYGEGDAIRYDFARIEAVLTSSLLKDKCPMNIAIRRFQYKGEIRKGNALATLANAVPQLDLPDDVRDDITAEVDTQYNARVLLNFVEDVIEFVSTVSRAGGGQGCPPDMLMARYAADVMKTDSEALGLVVSASVRDLVRLEHLQALFFLLEENTNGSFLDRILPQYREPLSDGQKHDVLRARSKLDLGSVLRAMRELMMQSPGLVQDGPTLPSPSLPVRDFLDYIDGPGDDYMVDIKSYAEHFPASLTMGTCLAAYQILSNATVNHVVG